MIRILFYLLVGFSQVTFAQQQPGIDDVEESGINQPADPCKSVDDGLQDNLDGTRSGDELGSPAELPSIDCGDNEGEPQDALVGAEADDEDFEPDEEISEDYPVPLPSDI